MDLFKFSLKTASESTRLRWLYLVLIVVVFIFAGSLVIETFRSLRASSNTIQNDICVSAPQPNAVLRSPLIVTGEAPGTWYFEAVFQLILVNWDGLIIADSYVEALDDWMTVEPVRFRGVLEFEKPYEDAPEVPEFMKRGTLIFRKANPSGLPEHDKAVEIPVRFE